MSSCKLTGTQSGCEGTFMYSCTMPCAPVFCVILWSVLPKADPPLDLWWCGQIPPFTWFRPWIMVTMVHLTRIQLVLCTLYGVSFSPRKLRHVVALEKGPHVLSGAEVAPLPTLTLQPCKAFLWSETRLRWRVGPVLVTQVTLARTSTGRTTTKSMGRRRHLPSASET